MTTPPQSRSPRGARALKRSTDLVGAGLGLAVLSPLLLGIACASAITQGRPVIFRQQRAGLAGQPFQIVKFRTMRSPRADEVAFHTDSERVTRLGGWLRATSFDELPELWNVLKGEMSLVGPRPLLMEYLDGYTPEEARRHDVRPGITGWAAVNGRHDIPFEDRLKFDTWYVDNCSFRLDMRILASTFTQVILRRGVSTVQTVESIQMPSRFWTESPGEVPIEDDDQDRPGGFQLNHELRGPREWRK